MTSFLENKFVTILFLSSTTVYFINIIMLLSHVTILIVLVLIFSVSISRGYHVLSSKSWLYRVRNNQVLQSTFNQNNENQDISSDDFNPADFIKVLKEANPIPKSTASISESNDFLSKLREQQTQRYMNEEVYRKYPFESIDLPILPDCNNYYSGKYQEYMWHQNADQVLLYIPLKSIIAESNNDSIQNHSFNPKRDIECNFQTNHIKLSYKGKSILDIKTFDKIIPDGSFWVIETNLATQEKYIQLDLEKRFRMINWKKLSFDENKDTPREIDESKNEMLQKLFAANKGLSKITGAPAETMEEMSENEELMKRITGTINRGPMIVNTEGGDSLSEADRKAVEDEIGYIDVGMAENTGDLTFSQPHDNDDSNHKK